MDPLLQRYVDLVVQGTPESAPPLTLVIEGVVFIGRFETDQAFMQGANEVFDTYAGSGGKYQAADIEPLKWDEELVRGGRQADIRYVTLEGASIVNPHGQVARVPRIRVDLESVEAWWFGEPTQSDESE